MARRALQLLAREVQTGRMIPAWRRAVAGALASSEADLVIRSETSVRQVELFTAAGLAHAVVYPTRLEGHHHLLVLGRHPVESVGAVPLVDGSA